MSFYPNIPYNDLPLLSPAYNFDDAEILKKVNKANIALSRLSGEAKSISNREVLIEPLTFREAVASSEIENINTTQSVIDIRELMSRFRSEISSKLPKIYSAELVEFLFSHPYCSQKSLQNVLKISRNTASKYFSELVRIGILSEQKYKNDKVYFSPQFHELLK